MKENSVSKVPGHHSCPDHHPLLPPTTPPGAAWPCCADPGEPTPTHRWHSQPRPLRSRSPSPRRSATRRAHTCGWWVRSSASLQDTPAWLWRQTHVPGLAKEDTGPRANQPHCLAPAIWPEALGIHHSLPVSCVWFLHLRSPVCPEDFLNPVSDATTALPNAPLVPGAPASWIRPTPAYFDGPTSPPSKPPL